MQEVDQILQSDSSLQQTYKFSTSDIIAKAQLMALINLAAQSNELSYQVLQVCHTIFPCELQENERCQLKRENWCGRENLGTISGVIHDKHIMREIASLIHIELL